MKPLNAFLLALLVSTIAISPVIMAQEINSKKLDSFLNILSVNDKAMGSFIIAKNGKTVYQKTTGYSQIEADKKIHATAETQYRIGSISKTFTAVIAFQLIEEKKLTLDTKLALFFPQMPNADKITIANLLNHTSGLADYVSENLTWIVAPHTKAELLDTMAKSKVHFEPGAKQQYSNGGYLLLTYILEKITGKPYALLVKNRIIDKIGLKSTIAGTVNSSQKLEARPFKFSSTWTPVKDLYFPNVVGVGDILSTPQDLSTFMIALCSSKLTSTESFHKMKMFDGNNRLGMGLLRMPFYEKTLIGHTGGTLGTYSFLLSIPEEGMTIAYCVNASNYKLNDITLGLLNACYNMSYQLPDLRNVQLTTEDLDGLLGDYTSKDLPLKIAITKSGDVLVAQATGQPSFVLDALSKNEFKQDGIGAVLKFDREKHEMTLIQNGKSFHYTMEK